jgi:hypothetical protein
MVKLSANLSAKKFFYHISNVFNTNAGIPAVKLDEVPAFTRRESSQYCITFARALYENGFQVSNINIKR